ncbi:MAG: flippase activity-associated protein Agl23, partial [Anaerolineales bacterium]
MNSKTNSWLERPIHPALPAITNEIALFAGIMLLAVITRFYNLGARVMSHDESLHTYFSWLLYRGQGYQHTPMMHGPWQFHLIALSYFLFGASDFTARIPAALFSIATVWMAWYWRHYLGRVGALVAGLLMVISPFMLFYGRYVREDVYAAFSGVLLLYAVLRYFESGAPRYLFLVTIALVIHFLDKETSFIYAAQLLLFLAVYFIARVTRKPWEEKHSFYRGFIILFVIGIVLAALGAGLAFANRHAETLTGTETAAPANPTDVPTPAGLPSEGMSPSTVLIGLAVLALAAALVLLFQGYGWTNLLKERSFDLLILTGTFVLPMLIPFPIKWSESRLHVAIPTDAASVNALDARGITIIAAFVAIFFLISIVIGMLWNRNWWKYGALFWGAFTILYTTVFTNAPGFFTGLIGSLGYWLVQQGVERGSQPEYYYVLVQIPIYEFLPAIGAIVAVVLGLKKLFVREQTEPVSEASEVEVTQESESNESTFGVFFGLLLWWAVASITALTVAGERMPWLTYHMAWPMILLAGWGIGNIIESVSARLAEDKPGRTALAILVLIVFVLATFNTLRALYGGTPPFQGTELAQLQATSAFLFPLITAILSGALLAYLMHNDLVSLAIVSLFILGIVTLTSSIINGAMLLSLTANPIADTAITSSGWLKFAASL